MAAFPAPNSLSGMNLDLSKAEQRLWQRVTAQFPLHAGSVHGPGHWRRVFLNAEKLAKRTGADRQVIRLFALFHDSRREHDGHDPDHGARGAEFAATLRGQEFDLDDTRWAIFQYACRWHTQGKHHADPTIGTCWDADRLDLGRVGIRPHPKFMSTAYARELAEKLP
jgi:uncharacterized protein